MSKRSDATIELLIDLGIILAILGVIGTFVYAAIKSPNRQIQESKTQAKLVAVRDTYGQSLYLKGKANLPLLGGIIGGTASITLDGSSKPSSEIVASIEFQGKFYDIKVPLGLAINMIEEAAEKEGLIEVVVWTDSVGRLGGGVYVFKQEIRRPSGQVLLVLKRDVHQR